MATRRTPLQGVIEMEGLSDDCDRKHTLPVRQVGLEYHVNVISDDAEAVADEKSTAYACDP